MEALILLFLLMAAGRSSGGGGGEGAERETPPNIPTGPRALPVSTPETPPWPQVVPSGLPAFPSGWEYDEPPPAEVRARAWALLQQLWKQGQGAKVVEQTGGRWITYRAEITKGQKRGVVAYRLKRAAAVPNAPARPQQTAQRAPAPAPAPAAPSAAQAQERSPGVPQKVSTQAPTDTRPLLVQGAGKGALAHLAPWVKVVQAKLGVDLSKGGAGEFGPLTRAAVERFQSNHSLKVDGKVGPLTWAALDRVAMPAAA